MQVEERSGAVLLPALALQIGFSLWQYLSDPLPATRFLVWGALFSVPFMGLVMVAGASGTLFGGCPSRSRRALMAVLVSLGTCLGSLEVGGGPPHGVEKLATLGLPLVVAGVALSYFWREAPR